MDGQQQQGDLNIWRVESLPADGTTIPSGIVREGEHTGHAHRITGTSFRLLESSTGRVVAKIESDDCLIVHAEHEPQPLTPGLWWFGAVHEYDSFANRSRPVVD